MAEDVEIETADQLIEWIRAEPETAWRIITKRQTIIEELQATIENLRVKHADEMIHLKEQIATETPATPDQDMEEEYARLREELTETQKVRDEAIRERDGVVTAMRLMGPGSARGSPALSDTNPRKSAQMPDPPMLSDGKDVKFKAWKTDIRKKLRLNHDHLVATN